MQADSAFKQNCVVHIIFCFAQAGATPEDLAQEDEEIRSEHNLPKVDGAHWIAVGCETRTFKIRTFLPLCLQNYNKSFPKGTKVLVHDHPMASLNGQMGVVDSVDSRHSGRAIVSLLQIGTTEPLQCSMLESSLLKLSLPVHQRAVVYNNSLSDLGSLPKFPINDYIVFPGPMPTSNVGKSPVHHMDVVCRKHSPEFQQMFLAGRTILVAAARSVVELHSQSLRKILGCYLEIEGMPSSRVFTSADLKDQNVLHQKQYQEHILESYENISKNILGMEDIPVFSFLGQDISQERSFLSLQSHMYGFKLQSWSCFSILLYHLGRIHTELHETRQQFLREFVVAGGREVLLVPVAVMERAIPQWYAVPDPFQTKGNSMISSMESWPLPWEADN